MIRKSLWILLVVVTLILAACGPAMQPTTDGKTPTNEILLLAIPRIVINFDADGNPSMLGVKLKDAGHLFGAGMDGMRLNKFYVDWMTTANVQHIEMRQTGDGLALLANGQPLPHVAWDNASFQQASNLAPLFNVPVDTVDMVKKLLPIVRHLGLNVVLKFPLRPDAKPIPLADPSIAMTKVEPEEATTTASAKFEIKYDQQGTPGILGITAQDLLALSIPTPSALDTNAIRALQARNTQYMELRTKPEGLFIYINGEPLPNLAWDNTMLTNAADIYTKMNPTSPYVTMVKQIAPNLDNVDLAVLVHFPLAAGASPIKITRH